jgi:CPA2 family monovalent cation:H+ antiporter-2
MTNPGTSSGRIPANVSVKARATVTAGFANDVEAVNQYADVNGPTGRTVVRLRDNGIAPTVIELNMEAVRALRHAGIDAIYGDATRPETLGAASIATAGALILGSAGMANSTEVIRMARGLNPEIRVLARAPYLRDIPSLKDAGANAVYSGEGEVALAFIEDILDSLGATPEQIDRERERAHRELFGEA